jgi:hypothetical protein
MVFPRRTKILLLSGQVLIGIGSGCWFFWSPGAVVSGSFSLWDAAAIRWTIRKDTLERIISVSQEPDGTVLVQTLTRHVPMLNGDVGPHYSLKKTAGGWVIVKWGSWAT